MPWLVSIRLASIARRSFTSVITLTEVLVHPFRQGNTHLGDEYRALLLTSRDFLTLHIDAAIAEQAANLRALRAAHPRCAPNRCGARRRLYCLSHQRRAATARDRAARAGVGRARAMIISAIRAGVYDTPRHADHQRDQRRTSMASMVGMAGECDTPRHRDQQCDQREHGEHGGRMRYAPTP